MMTASQSLATFPLSSTIMGTYEALQSALFARFTDNTPCYVLSQEHCVSITSLGRAYNRWVATAPESQPESPRDVHFSLRSRGRPLLIPPQHCKIIVESIEYFAENNTPLMRPGVRELIRTYVGMLGYDERNQIDLGDDGPSDSCINNLMDRHGLKYMAVQVVEDKRLEAITPETVSEHVSRVQAVIDRYRIRDPKYIFNTDQSGSSFKRMCGRSLRKGFGKGNRKLQQACVRPKGQLDRITVMSCVPASGKAYKPVIIYPGVRPHYRKVKGIMQGLHSVLPDCYLHYREVPGADSAIAYDWAVNFLEETKDLRTKGQHLLLILDGYSAHTQFSTLNLFRRNRVIVIALPAHSSHRLQPLDVSVFCFYKSFLQGMLHTAARVRTVLNAFDLGSIISHAYGRSMTLSNIRSGFERCGIWDPRTLGTNISKLDHLFVETCGNENVTVSVQDLVVSFLKKGRSLLRDADVEEEDTVKINTTKGLHLTSEAAITALERREEKKKARAKQLISKPERLWQDVREPPKALRHYAELADRRHEQRKRLRESRRSRRTRQKTLVLESETS